MLIHILLMWFLFLHTHWHVVVSTWHPGNPVPNPPPVGPGPGLPHCTPLICR